jgi:hypothetical protein
MQRNRLGRLLLVILFLIILVAGWQTILYLQHRGKVPVNIVVLPDDSDLKIDGAKAKPGKIYLTPGTHHLEARRNDFDPASKTIDTHDIPPGDTVYLLPGANSQPAKDYLLQHPDIQRLREAVGGIEAEKARAALLKKYPVIGDLPHETLHFKIDYSLDSNQALSFTITTYAIINGPSDYASYLSQTKDYRQEALNYLKDKGVDTTKYDISYTPRL